MDKYGLGELFRRKALPSDTTVAKCLKRSKISLPNGVPAEFIAKSIIARLGEADPDTVQWIKAHKDLKCKLARIKTGKNHAKEYHQHIFHLLTAIYEGILENGRIEQEVDEGLGFIDIVFDNNATKGFFAQLKQEQKISCAHISFECKNYSGDLGNDEYNQLSSRLNPKRGMIGFLVCRSIKDKGKSRKHCKSRFNNKKEHIIVLEDSDIRKLWDRRKKGKLEDMDKILHAKFTELVM